MSGDVVRNEANAVKALKSGVERYTQTIQAATAQARRELMTAERQAQQAVDQRRAVLQRAEREVQQAKAALSGSTEENRRHLEQQVRTAMQWQGEAKQQMDRARRAEQQVASARTELISVLQSSEAAVSEHSSVAASALANLEAKLQSLPAQGFMSTPAGMVARAVVTEVAVPVAVEVGAHVLGGHHGLEGLHAPGVADTINEGIKTTREALGDE